MKSFKKSGLEVVNGFLFDKKTGERVTAPVHVIKKLNDLDTKIQQAVYLADQPEGVKAPSLDGFERKSVLKAELPLVKVPETPLQDAKVEKSLKLVAELDAVADAEDLNEIITDWAEVIFWLDNDRVVSEDGGYVMAIDLPTLGDITKLKSATVIEHLKELHATNAPV